MFSNTPKRQSNFLLLLGESLGPSAPPQEASLLQLSPVSGYTVSHPHPPIGCPSHHTHVPGTISDTSHFIISPCNCFFPTSNSPGYHLLNCQVLSHQIPLPSFPPSPLPELARHTHAGAVYLSVMCSVYLVIHPTPKPENGCAQQKETPVLKNKLFLSLVIEN